MNNEEVKQEEIKQEEVKVEETKVEKKDKKEEVVEEPSFIKEEKENIKKEKISLTTFFKDLKDYLTKKGTKELGELALRLILIAVVVIVFYVPFQLFSDLGKNIIMSLNINFTDKFLNLYNAIFNIVYDVCALIAFFSLCKKRFYNIVEKQEILGNK